MRSIVEIFDTLKIEQPEQIDFSLLEFNPQLVNNLLNVNISHPVFLYIKNIFSNSLLF